MLKGKTKHGVDIHHTYGMPGKPNLPLWVLVMNRSEARIFTRPERHHKLQMVEEIINPDGRLQSREIVSDKHGRSFESFTASQSMRGQNGTPRHGLSNVTDPKEEITRRFAKRVSSYLRKAHAMQRFGQLVYVTEPHLMGQLRENLGSALGKDVVGEYGRDLAGLSHPELIQKLEQLMETS